MKSSTALPADKLAHRCDPAQFRFATTAELGELTQVVGQDRAAAAVEFGIGIERHGYNLFVMGPTGSGKHTLVKHYLAKRVREAAKTSDWAYVNNFSRPYQPIAIELPPGRGMVLKEDMRHVVEELRSTIPAVLESDEYSAKVEQIDSEFNERHERTFSELGAEASREGIALLRTPAGFSFAPLKDGEVIAPQEFAKLPDEEKRRIEETIARLQSKLERIVRDVMRWRKERYERIKALNREMVLLAVGHVTDELKQSYIDLPKVVEYLESVQRDVLENADDFKKPAEEAGQGTMRIMMSQDAGLRRYEVNVLVDRSTPDGSPVVVEDYPTYQNLVGRVDHIAQFGTLVTDFNLIKAGALHRANGGYLLLDVVKVLMQPFAWEGLKRALRQREIRIESISDMYGLATTVSLEPEPIPLDVKVVLIGERIYYYLLQAYDPDFKKLFRVAADFEDAVDRSEGNSDRFVSLVATAARQKNLLPLDREAAARAVDQASRLAGDAKKISSNLDATIDLLAEADYLARKGGRPSIGGEDVSRALEAQRGRSDRLQSRLREAILRGTLLVDTAGAAIGQVNGLSVYQVGNFDFGTPTRITATTRPGDGRVVDIQREVQLGGSIHSKGVLILSSFLASRFSAKRPFSLSASLSFEQTYGEVEGDSASLAELCALLSSLAGVPIRQSMAVTGSVNQRGEVQAIGGVNEKIEGFFDVCNARGLTGDQGVVIPESNVDHLMLREDVIGAAQAGRFHVHAVRNVDEAVDLLMGMPAGDSEALGEARPDTVYGRVAQRLQQYAALRRPQSDAKQRRTQPRDR
ncbi:MAG: ATP-dependent protease [Betaproteobacteria bacterium RIFCSPLOWO2_02_FULL_63_19]|nr:MAG: ATP-dependent protease [Betaproteobacteria bacterium RIFCSPLOWO2_02_FULL_63_19]